MTQRQDSERKRGWRGWIGPTVTSAIVFTVLTVANDVNWLFALGLAAIVIAGGLLLLRLGQSE